MKQLKKNSRQQVPMIRKLHCTFGETIVNCGLLDLDFFGENESVNLIGELPNQGNTLSSCTYLFQVVPRTVRLIYFYLLYTSEVSKQLVGSIDMELMTLY